MPMSTASLVTVPRRRPTVSFELYPPRTPARAAATWETTLRLAAGGPDFFSVTYGASGSSRGASRELVRRIITETTVPPVAHLTCVGATRAALARLVAPPAGRWAGEPAPAGVGSAAGLVALTREVGRTRLGTSGRLSVAVAAYPAGTTHTRRQDVTALLEKQDAGADYAVTQVFFDPADYLALVAEARAAGVHLPVVAGVVPLTDPRRLLRLEELTAVPVPPHLRARLAAPADDEERHRIGVAATVALLEEVPAAGAPGTHLFTFNQHRPALDVVAGLDRPLTTTTTRTL